MKKNLKITRLEEAEKALALSLEEGRRLRE